jgi:hypothetical protein
MISAVFNKIIQQNQWYDSLAVTDRTTRFRLFLIPMLVGFNLDLVSIIMGGPILFTYISWVIMAAWRLPYVVYQRRTARSG